jgi:hypothetical protein
MHPCWILEHVWKFKDLRKADEFFLSHRKMLIANSK